ncbi:MAG TPA: anhydro-N-acetylmuramic acid kinase [Ferruginibacter sp.]|nr:anhydro-N-acetylmuramic acid kinase [Ferruginibacter sp.]
MNQNIERLYAISNKPLRQIIGLMSGTSVDGLDVALCAFKGSGLDTEVELLQFETVSFAEEMKAEVRSVFSKKQVDLEKLTLLNPWIALQHAAIINALLQKWKIKSEDIDLVASHGQTIYHAPLSLHQQDKFGNATLQIGDGDHLAVATGITCISDFRQKHIAAGGEGAPLAVYGDYLVFGKKGEDRVLLNIGGIANFTYLPGDMDTTKIFSTDTGPGNTMMDAYIQQHFAGKCFDENAAVASKGKIHTGLLTALKENDFFEKPFPKTTGPELFNLEYLQNAIQKSSAGEINVEDTMATLNNFSADTIVDAIKRSGKGNMALSLYSSGGGMHNPLLMEHIKTQLPECKFYTTSELQINPDAKEAVLFAILANECVCGDVSAFGKGSPGIPAVSMGKISFPA